MIDYITSSIQETQIMDVFEHHAPKKKEEVNDVPDMNKTILLNK